MEATEPHMTDRPNPPSEFDSSQSYQEILSTPLEELLRVSAPQDLAGRMSDEIPDEDRKSVV